MGEKLTFGDLKPGDFFIAFPEDGDNSGHGGYLGSQNVFLKIEPCYTKKNYDSSFGNELNRHPGLLMTAVPLGNRGFLSGIPDRMPVIKLS